MRAAERVGGSDCIPGPLAMEVVALSITFFMPYL